MERILEKLETPTYASAAAKAVAEGLLLPGGASLAARDH